MEKCKDLLAKMRQKRLQWFGHLRRKAVGGGNESAGKRKAERPKITCRDTVKQYLEILGVDEMTVDQRRWRKVIASLTPT